jgi:hypothetical protein
VHPRWALIALGEELERVDPLDEVCHAGLAAESEADHQDPSQYERVNHEHPQPARQEGWGFSAVFYKKNISSRPTEQKKQCVHDTVNRSVWRDCET